MWTLVLAIYAVGLFVTAMMLFRSRLFEKDRVMVTGSVILWPFYWAFYAVALFQNRRR